MVCNKVCVLLTKVTNGMQQEVCVLLTKVTNGYATGGMCVVA